MLPSCEGKVCGELLRFVTVMVRVAMGLVAVWMPKSSSRGEKTIAFGVAVVAGSVMVCVALLA